MNDLSDVKLNTLPSLIDRAAGALTSARDSAEVLEARDLARVAYDAAKSAGRMMRARQAHEAIIAAVYRAQADALLIEARAKMRLADEYDAAQQRGEVKRLGGDTSGVEYSNTASAADLGLRRDEIHEARQIRDAEASDPGKAERALNQMVEAGEEPTKAKLRREMKGDEPSAEKQTIDRDEKLRREFRAMTPEAQEDDWIGLRTEVEESRKRIASQRGEIADLKSQIKEFEQADIGRSLGNAQRRATAAEGRMREHQSTAARLQRQVNAQKAEIEKLRRQLGEQEITL